MRPAHIPLHGRPQKINTWGLRPQRTARPISVHTRKNGSPVYYHHGSKPSGKPVPLYGTDWLIHTSQRTLDRRRARALDRTPTDV